MRLTKKLMAGVAASAALFPTAGCHSNNNQPCDDRNQPCGNSSSGYSGGVHGGFFSSGSSSGRSSEGDAGHGSEGGSFGRSGGFGHGGGGEGGG
jgi:hypothetical protein